MSSPDQRRTGRRGGRPQTRQAIAAAAQTQFAELGFDRATFRGIAAAAGVDPALVVHFYGNKKQLFREVMSLPPNLADAIARLAEGPRRSMGRRLAEAVLASLENPGTRAVVLGRIRSASSHPDAADLVRETVASDLRKLTDALSVDQPALRATLIGATVVGVALARHIVLVEPLSTMPAESLVDVLAPTFQRYLTGPLN